MMNNLTTTALAKELGVTPGRVSQMVASGQLDGCYSGEKRDRRFDLDKCAVRLNKVLHPGQMMGNGRRTKKRLHQKIAPTASQGNILSLNSNTSYDAARTQKAIEEARTLKRKNEEQAGRYVLASEVELTISRLLIQEISEIEVFLKKVARKLSDKYNLNFRLIRKEIMDDFRMQRVARDKALKGKAKTKKLSTTEKKADI